MANDTTTTGFSMYSPRVLKRTVFSGFQGAGIDLFTDPATQNPNSFLDLTNVMPTLTGSFVRRWGMSDVSGNALPRPSYKRMFSYSAKQDVTFSGTVDSSLILGTDDTHVDILYQPSGVAAFGIPNFSGTGSVHGVSSRAFFYACDGVGQPKKVDYSQQTVNTSSNWGIASPSNNATTGAGVFPGFLTVADLAAGTGGNYSGSTAVVYTGGGGTGAVAVPILSSGVIVGFIQVNGGSGYTSAPAVTITDTSGSGAGNITAIVDLDSNSATYKQVIATILTGPITLNLGRRYAVAFKNSVTGHVSDYHSAYFLASVLNPITCIGDTSSASFITTQTGVDLINVKFVLQGPGLFVDPQVDTVVILATADGGDLSTLYEVQQTLLSSWAFSPFPNDTYTLSYTDTLADTATDNFPNQTTLLNNNIWVEPDGLGGFLGIFGNTPPPFVMNKPILHKGRMFGTDGKSIFFSKSLSEVTTSTGLITSKWEEAWPGINQLDIAYGNETINALLSDGDILYIGTSDNIYRLLGDNATNFSIPSAIFRGVGVVSQEAWTVVYKDDIPAGYMWITPDSKIMLSDFNTYEEIGKYIYPLFATGFNVGSLQQIQSVSYGPYSLAVLALQATNTQLTYLVWDTKSGGWYKWVRPVAASIGFPPSTALLTYTNAAGISQVFTCVGTNYGTPKSFLQFFSPVTVVDSSLDTNSNQVSPWSIQTSWLNLGEAVSFKVLNDIEVWTVDSSATVSVQRATDDLFTSSVVKSGSLVTGPLQTKKLFLAGSPSCARYFNFKFSGPTINGFFSGNGSPVLRQFSVEHFPQTRL